MYSSAIKLLQRLNAPFGWVVGLNLALALTVGSTQAFANGAIELNQAEFYSTITADVVESLGGNYVLTEGINIATADAGAPPSGSTVFGTFTGTLDGGGFAITGLTKPLFEGIEAATNEFSGGVEIDTVEIKDLDLYAATGEGGGITGNGALANILVYDGTIDNVSFTGDISGESGNYGMFPVGIGGLVGVSVGTISNSYAAGTVDGDSFVGGLVGVSVGTISNSYATGDVTGIDNVGGLVGVSVGTISNSYATGDVTGSGEYIGGLVGWLEVGGTISNSYAKTGTVEGDHGIGGLVGYSSGSISGSYAEGNVIGFEQVGGLVGSTGVATEITDSYATGTVTGSGDDVGGLVGLLDFGHTITNSYAAGTVEGTDDVGGLVGYSEGTITNSYATGEVRGTGTNQEGDFSEVGGLVGESVGTITNSYAAGTVEGTNDVGGLVGYSEGTITNSYATGEVRGTGTNQEGGFSEVGGLVGYSEGTITNSYATGNVTGALVFTGRLVGYPGGTIDDDSSGYGAANRGGILIEDDPYPGEGEAPDILDIVNTSLWDDFVPAFGENASINGGRPYLTSLIDSYDVADTEETPFFNLRSYYTQAAKSLGKDLTSFGFKSNFSSHPNLGFQALDQNQSKLPAAIQLFEVYDYQNSNILLNKEDGLQLSISSYYKEPVEIWTQGLNGEYLYLGLVEFDKDGKAILPALKFDTANTYQLLMIKAADKLSQKPNLEAKVGQININVF